MTMTEETTDTVSEADVPDNVIVEEPRPVAVGDIVVKTVHPQIYDGLVLHVNHNVHGVQRAYLVGRREEGGDWHLIMVETDSLTRRDLAGDTPGYAEIGAALAAKQADMERSATLRQDAEASLLEARNAANTRNDRVRELIIDQGEGSGWDDDEVNELLRRLDLEEKVQEWSINVDVTARQSVYVTVTAANLDDAINLVENDSDLVAGALETWEMDDDYEIDTYNSSAAD